MSKQIELKVTLELRADTIFGSGFSIPGGEDIAVCQDENGYPYLKGTTFKGLLRESMSNLLDWCGEADAERTLKALLGAEGWLGEAGERRLSFTPLLLENPPEESEDCYEHRTFTSLEDGVVKTGSLRTVVCICRGQRFTGAVYCEKQDAALVCEAVRGIKWAGTMRSRGFGAVSVTAEPVVQQNAVPTDVQDACCLHYTLHTETPVSMTDYNRSGENSWDTHGCITGAAMRGMAASLLAQREPEWFEKHKAALLGESTRFLSALPTAAGKTAVLPSIKGFYEKKDGSEFQSVVIKGEFAEGSKRADVGSFCTIENGTLHYWNAATGGSMRILRAESSEEKQMFQTRSISAGQTFEGYIQLDDAALAPKLAETLCGTVWLGADRYSGMGKCRAAVEACEAPAYSVYGSAQSGENDREFYLLAVSPLCMMDEAGEPCGLNESVLAERLGIDWVKTAYSSSSVSEYGGFNRRWGCRTPAVRMYDAGSLFHIECSGAPDKDRLAAIERAGLGLRRAEGFGQVLFLSKALFEGIKRKRAVEKAAESREMTRAAQLRRQRLVWIMDKCAGGFAGGISPSQLGSLQTECERCIGLGGNTAPIQRFFKKNDEKGAKNMRLFLKVRRMIASVLDGTEADWIAALPVTERLRLLCELFDHSRKSDNSRKEEKRDGNVR